MRTVQRVDATVQRVETILPRQKVYRPLRGADRDAWLREVITRFADPTACVPNPIARCAGSIVRSAEADAWRNEAHPCIVDRRTRSDDPPRRIADRSDRTAHTTARMDDRAGLFGDRRQRRRDRSARTPNRTARRDHPTRRSTLSGACRARSNTMVSVIAPRRELTVPCDTLIAPRGEWIVPRRALTDSVLSRPFGSANATAATLDGTRPLDGASATARPPIVTEFSIIVMSAARIATGPRS